MGAYFAARRQFDLPDIGTAKAACCAIARYRPEHPLHCRIDTQHAVSEQAQHAVSEQTTITSRQQNHSIHSHVQCSLIISQLLLLEAINMTSGTNNGPLLASLQENHIHTSTA